DGGPNDHDHGRAANIRSNATDASAETVGATEIWLGVSPATKDSTTQARWAGWMRYMVEHGQMTGSRQKIVMSGCWACKRFTRLISVPMANTSPGCPAAMALRMYSVEPTPSAASTTGAGHSGWTMTWALG